MAAPTRGGVDADSGGLTAGQTSLLDKFSLSGDRATFNGRIVEIPQSVSDWSSLPAGWAKTAPSAGSSLTAANWCSFAAGGVTMSVDDADSYEAGPESANFHGKGTQLLYIPIDPSLDTLDVSVTVDSFTNHTGLTGSTFFFFQLSLFHAPTAELGGWCSGRIYYADAAAGNSGDPKWFCNKRHRPNNENDQQGNDSETIQQGASDPGEQVLRLRLTDNLRAYQVYIGETQVGTGAVEWSNAGTGPDFDNSSPLPLFLGFGPACSADVGTAITCRVTDFTVNAAS